MAQKVSTLCPSLFLPTRCVTHWLRLLLHATMSMPRVSPSRSRREMPYHRLQRTTSPTTQPKNRHPRAACCPLCCMITPRLREARQNGCVSKTNDAEGNCKQANRTISGGQPTRDVSPCLPHGPHRQHIGTTCARRTLPCTTQLLQNC